eukprot:g7388.t1
MTGKSSEELKRPEAVGFPRTSHETWEAPPAAQENREGVSQSRPPADKVPKKAVLQPPTPDKPFLNENGLDLMKLSDAELAAVVPLNEKGERTSIGALKHPDHCSRCIFWFRNVCEKGIRCEFCHFQHPGQVAKKIRPSKSFRMKQKDPASGDGEMDEREERQERMTGLGRFDLADGDSCGIRGVFRGISPQAELDRSKAWAKQQQPLVELLAESEKRLQDLHLAQEDASEWLRVTEISLCDLGFEELEKRAPNRSIYS